MATRTSGNPQTLTLYPRKTTIAKPMIATIHPCVVFRHCGSSTVVGSGRPKRAAFSFSIFRLSAINRARSPVIWSTMQTDSISVT